MRSRKLLRYIILILGAGLGIYLLVEPLYTPTALPASTHLFHFPKYTICKVTISSDFKEKGFKETEKMLADYSDGIEVEVHLSKDKILFLYNAETLEEFTDGHGRPEEHTWESLEKLIYKNSNKLRLLTLDDFLRLVNSQKFVFLNIKTEEIFNNKLATELTKLIYKHHLQETVSIKSFNPFFLTLMRLKARDILLTYNFTTNSSVLKEEGLYKVSWLLKKPFFQKQFRRIIRPDILGLYYNYDERIIKTLVLHGYPVIVGDINDPIIAHELFNIGVKGVFTSKPEMALIVTGITNLLYDSGGTFVRPNKIIHVKEIKDILFALMEAKRKKKKISIAGRRHSMGGQSLLEGSLNLNMLNFDKVTYNLKTKTLIAESGATWKKIQNILDQHGRSVKVMQSDNIFTIGGSASVNVHGWQQGAPPFVSTIVSMKVITADGRLRHITRNKEPELFKAIVGGYGVFGVITEVEIETVPNSLVKFDAKFISSQEFEHNFKKYITDNPQIELAYGRLSVDPSNLFEEIGLFWYERDSPLSSSQKIQPESLVAIKRGVFRASQYFDLGKKLRWYIEKLYARKMKHESALSRNNAMIADIHVLWPLYGQNKDILHEYFIPKGKFSDFIKLLKKNILMYDMNILNVTIREVLKDNVSLLPYARNDAFAFVCFFSQPQNLKEEEKMIKFTQAVIDEVLSLNGTFYLPYRLHYTQEQMLRAYPSIVDWVKSKKRWDPDNIFDNQFFQYVENITH